MKPSAVFSISIIIFGLVILSIIDWKRTVVIFVVAGIASAMIATGFLIERIAKWLEKADEDFENRKIQ